MCGCGCVCVFGCVCGCGCGCVWVWVCANVSECVRLFVQYDSGQQSEKIGFIATDEKILFYSEHVLN